VHSIRWCGCCTGGGGCGYSGKSGYHGVVCCPTAPTKCVSKLT